MRRPVVRDFVLHLVERRLARHVSADRAAVLTGDLCEDYDAERATRSRVRATAWLVAEAWSMTRAYGRSSAPPSHRRGVTLDIALAEARHAVRRLVKRPAPTLTSILTMALGLGAGAATWSIIDAVLIHPLPVASPDRLVVVGTQSDQPGAPANPGQIYTTYVAIRDRRAFEATAGSGCLGQPIVSGGVTDTQGEVCFVSGNYFDVLGVRPALGRSLSADDDRRGGPLVAVVSDELWRRTLGADPSAIGRSVLVNGRTVAVVGVAPPAFRGVNLAQAPDLYLPLETVAEVGNEAMSNFFAKPIGRPAILSSPWAWITTIGRMAPAARTVDVTAKLNGLAGETDGGRHPFVLTGIEQAAIPEAGRAGMATFTRLLSSTVGLLLLVACLAVGMLLLVRTEARREEFAMCLALGATRARLALGVAAEAVILAVSGALAAVPTASWFLRGVRAFELPGRIGIQSLHLGVNGRVIGASAGLTTVAVLFVTATAAMFALAARPDDAGHSRSGLTPAIARRRARSWLVSGQVAVALVLVTGAGLFARSLGAALHLNTGFDTSRLVTATVSFPQYAFDTSRTTPIFDDLRSRLDADEAFRSVSMTAANGGMTPTGKVTVDGIGQHFPSLVSFTDVDERYFTTVGLPIVAGRAFTSRDRGGAPFVAIASQSFARLVANGGNPIGHKVRAFSAKIGQPFPDFEIVGVVPDVITSVARLRPLVLYRPIAQQDPAGSRTILLRAAADVPTAIREAQSALRAIDPSRGAVVADAETIDQHLLAQLEPQQFGAVVMGALGGLATLLAVLGAFVLAESMSIVRLREMGIRAALGASREQLVTLLLGGTGRLIAAGIAGGIMLAWLGAGMIRSLLFQVQPLDPFTLAAAGASIFVTTLLVSLGPALRATRVDLAGLLRSE